MKKRIFSILCAAAMVFSLTACGSKTETTGTSADTSPAASGIPGELQYPVADAELVMLGGKVLPPDCNPHIERPLFKPL